MHIVPVPLRKTLTPVNKGVYYAVWTVPNSTSHQRGTLLRSMPEKQSACASTMDTLGCQLEIHQCIISKKWLVVAFSSTYHGYHISTDATPRSLYCLSAALDVPWNIAGYATVVNALISEKFGTSRIVPDLQSWVEPFLFNGGCINCTLIIHIVHLLLKFTRSGTKHDRSVFIPSRHLCERSLH